MSQYQTENLMQTLWLTSEQSDPFAVLRATGEVDLHNQHEFERVVGEMLELSPVVVDLSAVDFFAICALRSLIVCHNVAASRGHEVFWAEPPSQLARLLAISGLDGVLRVGSPVSQDVAVA